MLLLTGHSGEFFCQIHVNLVTFFAPIWVALSVSAVRDHCSRLLPVVTAAYEKECVIQRTLP
jgi:hypothetical protein